MEVIYTTNFQPDLLIGGLRIGEPVTVITDFLIVWICWIAWRRTAYIPADLTSFRLIRLFFIFLGCSALVSAIIGHAFMYRFPYYYKLPGWLFSLFAPFAISQASLMYLLRPSRYFYLISVVNISALMVAVGCNIYFLNFKAVEIYSAFALIVMSALPEYLFYKKNKDLSSLYLLVAIGFAVMAVLPHVFKWSFGRWFTYFDIGHIVLCFTVWYVMKSTMRRQEEIISK